MPGSITGSHIPGFIFHIIADSRMPGSITGSRIPGFNSLQRTAICPMFMILPQIGFHCLIYDPTAGRRSYRRSFFTFRHRSVFLWKHLFQGKSSTLFHSLAPQDSIQSTTHIRSPTFKSDVFAPFVAPSSNTS